MDKNLIDQYRQLHEQNPNYGNGATYPNKIEEYMRKLFQENVMRDPENHQTKDFSILDFGCGKGALRRTLIRRFASGVPYSIYEYDPAIPGKDELIDHQVDLVVAMDVLEHFTEDSLFNDLRKIASRSSNSIIANISCREAVHHLPDGRNAHTVMMNHFAWLHTLHSVWNEFSLMEMKWNPKNKNLYVVYQKPEVQS